MAAEEVGVYLSIFLIDKIDSIYNSIFNLVIVYKVYYICRVIERRNATK